MKNPVKGLKDSYRQMRANLPQNNKNYAKRHKERAKRNVIYIVKVNIANWKDIMAIQRYILLHLKCHNKFLNKGKLCEKT